LLTHQGESELAAKPVDTLLRLRHNRILGVVAKTRRFSPSIRTMFQLKSKIQVVIFSAATLLVLVPSGAALMVPFTEDFSTGASDWLSGAGAAPTWLEAGGAGGGGYISAPGAITSGGFGSIVFRGNNAADASGDAFVGNWLSGGVTVFSAYLRHDAPVALNFFARIDAGSGRAGSSVDFSVPAGQWFQLNVPIVDSPASFQSFGAGTFNNVFTNIQNIQIVLSSTQDPATAGQTYSVGLDQVSIVPEPGTLGLAVGGLAAVAWWHRCRSRHRRP
jgi:hypothetical protein